jgi:hypothetical protein
MKFSLFLARVMGTRKYIRYCFKETRYTAPIERAWERIKKQYDCYRGSELLALSSELGPSMWA